MFRVFLIVVFSTFFSFNLTAQQELTYKKVDSLTLKYFHDANWTALETVGEKAIDSGIDYFYLNLRIGLAKFKLGKYYEADKYYRKAEKSYPNDKNIKENMFWNYIWMNDFWLADGAYENFSEDEKQLIIYNTKDHLTFTYAEGGVKFSDISDTIGNLTYFGIGAYHKFSTKFALYHKLNFLTQENFNGSFNQFEYHFAPNYQLTNRIRLTGRLNYVYNKFGFDFNPSRRDTMVELPPMQRIVRDLSFNSDFNGDITSNTIFAQLGINYSIGRFKFDLDGGIFKNKIVNNYAVTTDTVVVTTTEIINPPNPPIISTGTESGTRIRNENEEFNENQIQLSVGLKYVLPFLEDRITLGSDFYYFNSDVDQFTFAPNFKIKASEKLDFSGRYLKKGRNFIAENGSSVTYNTNFIEREKISLTASYLIKTDKKVYLTLQNEDVEDNINNINYTNTNLFIGLKF